MSFINELFEKLVTQGAEETLGEVAYIGSVKVIGSAEDLASTLSSTAVLASAAKENMGVVGNSAIVCLGVYTGGSSALQFGITTDPKAKALYFTSVVFSASAVASGSVSVASRTCHISGTAALSEACGFAFMKLGNKAHVAALQLEGKPIPPRLQHLANPSIRPLSYRPNGLGFIMPNGMVSSNFIASIPFEKIGQIIGCGIAVYGYGRVVIVGYRYSQQFLSKFRSKSKAKLIRKQKIFLVYKIQRIISKARSKRQPNLFFSSG